MKHFLIITNQNKDVALRVTEKIRRYIEKTGGTAAVFVSRGETVDSAAPRREDIPPETGLVLVLGGDGTLIRAAERLVDSGLPLIGVNLGTMGYLCEVEESGVFTAIDMLMADSYMVEERMMLSGFGIKGGETVAEGLALNDIVIHRTGALSMVSMIVSVNGKYLHTFQGDGMILSTPTGSTGYNMSAGGPIVDPKAELILITPINAHNLSSRSIVLGPEDEVTIEIGKRRTEKDEQVEVSFDGDNAVRLEVGDRFRIRKAGNTARICRLSKKSFLEILSKKMQTYT